MPGSTESVTIPGSDLLLHPVFTLQTAVSRAGVLAGKFDRAMFFLKSLPTVSVAVDCKVSLSTELVYKKDTAQGSTESDMFTGSNLVGKTCPLLSNKFEVT